MVMRAGRRVDDVATNLHAIRQYAASELRQLPERLLALPSADPAYPVRVTTELEQKHAHVRARVVSNGSPVL
jgi:hypothetical protein